MIVVARERINWVTLLRSLLIRTDPRFTTMWSKLVGPRMPPAEAAPVHPSHPGRKPTGVENLWAATTAVEAVRELVPVKLVVKMAVAVAFG